MGRISSRLRRLELVAPAVTPEDVWPPVTTGEEATQAVAEVLEVIRARKDELDAALASGNPKQRALARRTIAEHEAWSRTPEAQDRLAVIRGILRLLRERVGAS